MDLGLFCLPLGLFARAEGWNATTPADVSPAVVGFSGGPINHPQLWLMGKYGVAPGDLLG